MRNPNGYGSIFKLSGNRRKPWMVKKTIGYNEKGHQLYQTIGYYEKREEALLALAEFNKSPFPIGSERITFEEIFKLWSNDKFNNATQTTINGYNAAYQWAIKLHAMKFTDIKTNHLQAAIKDCNKGHATKQRMKVLFGQLYDYAMANDIFSKNYAEYLKLDPNEVETDRKPFSQKEINLLLSNDHIPYVDTILIMIYSGIRPGELIDLKPEDINIDEQYFRVIKSKTAAGKNRLIPIHAKIIKYFQDRLATGSEHFMLDKNGNKMGYDHYYRYVFTPIMEELGMQHRPHDCRHTFATLINNANANKTSIKKIIGHSSFITTEKIYTHKDISELKKAVALIPLWFFFVTCV